MMKNNKISKSILAKHRTPFFLIDRSVFVKQYKKVKSACDEIAYSVKTNPNKKILQTLKEMGSSFSVSSIEELVRLKKLDTEMSSVHFYYVGANTDVFKQALSFGVRTFIVDSEQHFLNLMNAMEETGIMIDLFFRLKPSKKTLSTYSLPDQGIEKIKLIKLVRKAQSNTNIFSIGVHFHLITQNVDIASFKNMLLEVANILDMVKAITAVNLGGGIPISYANRVFDFEVYAKMVRNFSAKYPTIKVILEPGRFIIGPAGYIVTKVRIAEKDKIYLDASVYNVYPDIILYNIDLPCYSTSTKPKRKYRVLGKSPCSLDVFKKKEELNAVKEGDYVIFTHSGAYTFSTDFLSFRKPRTIVVDTIEEEAKLEESDETSELVV